MDIEREKLVNKITNEVLEVLKNKTGISSFSLAENDLADALVIGNPKKIPEIDRRKYNLYTLNNLENLEDIKRFDKIFVESLSLTELADIALGRDEGMVAKAVIGALLLNREVVILKSALIHRRFSYNSERNIYQTYEEYVRKLINMKVKIISGRDEINCCAFQKPDVDLPSNLITEAVARVMVNGNTCDAITIKHGSIVTPSAKDVFSASGKRIVIE